MLARVAFPAMDASIQDSAETSFATGKPRDQQNEETVGGTDTLLRNLSAIHQSLLSLRRGRALCQALSKTAGMRTQRLLPVIS
jgi:hypothetical protein